MDLLGSASNAALLASLLLLLSMLWIRRHQGHSTRQRDDHRLDTVQAWPSQLVPAMTPLQRRAYELLHQALPGSLILVHTPLAQFMRVSTRNSYVEWYRRAGRLRASFLVCDRHSNVIAAVDLRASNESEREQGRHARVVRVLESVGLAVLVWTEAELPSPSQVRQRLASLVKEQVQPTTAAQGVSPDLAAHMSGSAETMDMESTDFAALDTAPMPLDERGAIRPPVRRPRPV